MQFSHCWNRFSQSSVRAFALSLLCLAPIMARAADTSLVNREDTWRYRKGKTAPQGNWRTAADSALDVSWLSGKGGFGYSDSAAETGLCLTLLTDMKSSYTTLGFRKTFQVIATPDASAHLYLTMDWDDGFIAWLDGVYLTSEGSPNAPSEPKFSEVATGKHESSLGDSSRHPATRYDLGAIGTRLSVGSHILAVMGLNQDSASSDFVQVAELSYGVPSSNCMSGSLASSTVWRLDQSPVVVCGDVTVESGVTLTIEAGVTLQMAEGVSLIIADGGKLLAEGTPSAPLLFTHASGASNWGNVVLRGSEGSPETRISYAHFEFNAASTKTPCIEVAAGTADLAHLTFGNTGAPYIHVDGASFVIRDCNFPSATTSFELVHGTGGVKVGGHGIFLRNFFGRPIGYNDVVDFTGGNRPSPIVHFLNNVLSGSQDDGLDLDGTDAWVEGNIFLHVHRNGGTPDSSAAVSGGNDSTRTSEITVLRNLFFDCDNAATAKQGNFYTFVNNTVVHTTRKGGVDGGSGVVNVRDTTPSPTTFGRGYYLEGNVIFDAEQVVRNYDSTQGSVVLNRNLLPEAWVGPGTGNVIADPLLVHVPTVAETDFATWEEAQILREWFSLKLGSPAIAAGLGGRDLGAIVDSGIAIQPQPLDPAAPRSARFVMDSHWSGSGIPAADWPAGAGYTHYRWRLDGGALSAETSVSLPLVLTGLADGSHQIEVIGKRDSGLYQNDALFHEESVVSRSPVWLVGEALRFDRIVLQSQDVVELGFTALANKEYTLEFRDVLNAGSWQLLKHVTAEVANHVVSYLDALPTSTPTRFYRITTP